MSRWADAAFEQERLLGVIKHNPNFREYMMSYQETAYPQVAEPDMVLKLHQFMLQEADPMYVSAQVTELWDHARETFRPENLHPWDLPCNICFVLLPRPLRIIDANNDEIAFRAFSWIPAGSGEVEWSQDSHPEGLWYTLWSDIDDMDDFSRPAQDSQRESWEALGKWSILFSGFLPFGNPSRYFLDSLMNTNGLLTIPGEGIDMGVGADITFPDEQSEREFRVRQDTWVLLQTFWRLARQLVPTKEPLPRQLRRQRARVRRTEDVTIIKLRRLRHGKYDDAEVSEVEYRFQWIVRGHWRNQYYPSLGPKEDPQSHRQIWINPYMKGPEDKPIKPVKRAFEFTR